MLDEYGPAQNWWESGLAIAPPLQESETELVQEPELIWRKRAIMCFKGLKRKNYVIGPEDQSIAVMVYTWRQGIWNIHT